MKNREQVIAKRLYHTYTNWGRGREEIPGYVEGAIFGLYMRALKNNKFNIERIRLILMSQFNHERNCQNRESYIDRNCDCGRNQAIRKAEEAILVLAPSK